MRGRGEAGLQHPPGQALPRTKIPMERGAGSLGMSQHERRRETRATTIETKEPEEVEAPVAGRVQEQRRAHSSKRGAKTQRQRRRRVEERVSLAQWGLKGTENGPRAWEEGMWQDG